MLGVGRKKGQRPFKDFAPSWTLSLNVMVAVQFLMFHSPQPRLNEEERKCHSCLRPAHQPCTASNPNVAGNVSLPATHPPLCMSLFLSSGASGVFRSLLDRVGAPKPTVPSSLHPPFPVHFDFSSFLFTLPPTHFTVSIHFASISVFNMRLRAERRGVPPPNPTGAVDSVTCISWERLSDLFPPPNSSLEGEWRMGDGSRGSLP